MDTMALATVPRKMARGTFVILFWMVAALLVLAAHQTLDPISSASAATMKVVAIVGVAFAYVRLIAREVTLDQALAVGVAWLLFDIIVELLAARMAGHGWFELIGSPGQPWLRNLLMVTWITAPAIFARIRS